MKKNRTVTVSIFILLLCLSGWQIYKLIRQNIPARYSGFHIPVPQSYRYHGIDVSRYQGKIFWKEIIEMKDQGKEISFVFIKATEGADHQDKNLETNLNGAREAGLLKGAYHYFLPGSSATFQAENFIHHAGLAKGDLPPVLDVEEDTDQLTIAQYQDSICSWIEKTEQHYRCKPVLYSNKNIYNKVLKDRFKEYPLWIADYYKSQPSLSTKWTFWQHSDKGRVNGIQGPVDFNVFEGDSLVLETLLIQ